MHRQIIHHTNPERLTARMHGKRGKLCLATLECGHMEYLNSTELKHALSKGIKCFDCHYEKPIPAQGRITVAELSCTCTHCS